MLAWRDDINGSNEGYRQISFPAKKKNVKIQRNFSILFQDHITLRLQLNITSYEVRWPSMLDFLHDYLEPPLRSCVEDLGIGDDLKFVQLTSLACSWRAACRRGLASNEALKS